MRKSRKGRDNPKKDKNRLKLSKYTCFMSEVQLQGLLDRTKPSKGDEEYLVAPIFIKGQLRDFA